MSAPLTRNRIRLPRLVRGGILFVAVAAVLLSGSSVTAHAATSLSMEAPLGTTNVHASISRSGDRTGILSWNDDGRTLDIEFAVVSAETNSEVATASTSGVRQPDGTVLWTTLDGVGGLRTNTATYDSQSTCDCSLLDGGTGILGAAVCAVLSPIACVLYAGTAATVINQCSDACSGDPTPVVAPPTCAGQAQTAQGADPDPMRPGYAQLEVTDIVQCNESVDAFSMQQFLVDDTTGVTSGPSYESCGFGMNCANVVVWGYVTPGHCYHAYDTWLANYHAIGSPDENSVSGITPSSNEVCPPVVPAGVS